MTVNYGGLLQLSSAANVGGTVTLSSTPGLPTAIAPMLMSGLALNTDFAPAALTSSSYGVLDINTTSGPNINAALAAGAPQVGNGYMYYGSSNGSTFTGLTLQADLDSVYRLTVASGNWFTLDSAGTAVGALAGNNSVDISVDSASWYNWSFVRTNDANTFTGTLTVEPGAVFYGFTQPSTTSGSPFGSATGPVALNGGGLQLAGGANGLPVTKGATTIQGASAIWIQGASLTLSSLTRANDGVLTIQGVTDNGTVLGTTDQLFIANNAPAVTATNGGNGMVAPWMVEYNGRYFLSYNSTSGFVPATFTATGGASVSANFTSTATDVLNLPSGGTISGSQYAYAVRVGGSTGGAGGLMSTLSTDVLNIGSGGLILACSGTGDLTQGASYQLNNTANINFGTAEGVIYNAGVYGGTGANGWISNQLSGALTGSDGLTISGVSQGNHTSVLAITGTNTGLTGQITIDNTIVAFGSANSIGPATNTIYINGRPAPTATPPWPPWPLSRTSLSPTRSSSARWAGRSTPATATSPSAARSPVPAWPSSAADTTAPSRLPTPAPPPPTTGPAAPCSGAPTSTSTTA